MPTTNITATYDAGLKYDTEEQNWATIRAEATGSVEDAGNDYDISIWCSGSSNQYVILGRYGITIPTGTMAGKTISAATLKLYCSDGANDLKATSIGVTGFTPASSSTYVAADFNNFADTKFATDQLYETDFQIGEWISFAFNAAGLAAINKSGDSTFYVRIVDDIDNSNPGWSSGAGEWVAVDTVFHNVNKPYLSITYSDAAVTGCVGQFAAGATATFNTKP